MLDRHAAFGHVLDGCTLDGRRRRGHGSIDRLVAVLIRMMLVIGKVAFTILAPAAPAAAPAATAPAVTFTAFAFRTFAFGMVSVVAGHCRLARRLLVAILFGGAIGPVIGMLAVAVG